MTKQSRYRGVVAPMVTPFRNGGEIDLEAATRVTEHLVAALDAGGVDYVTKPIKPREVMARMGVHLRTARHAMEGAVEREQARHALDAFGYATITVREHDDA